MGCQRGNHIQLAGHRQHVLGPCRWRKLWMWPPSGAVKTELAAKACRCGSGAATLEDHTEIGATVGVHRGV